MKQTAVEWLIERINDPKGFNAFIIDNLIQQAKEMEKEQLEALKDFDTWKEWKNS
jgi:hypothetical protein